MEPSNDPGTRPAEREEGTQALLRRWALSDHESFTDEGLVAAADAVSSGYDEEGSKG